MMTMKKRKQLGFQKHDDDDVFLTEFDDFYHHNNTDAALLSLPISKILINKCTGRGRNPKQAATTTTTQSIIQMKLPNVVIEV